LILGFVVRLFSWYLWY